MEPRTDLKKPENIVILGAGNWGTTVALHLYEKNYPVGLWEYNKKYYKELIRFRENRRFLKGFPIPEKIEIYNILEEAVKEKDIIIFAIPSHSVRNVLYKLKDIIKKDKIKIVSLVKGIENNTLMLMSQVIKQVIPEFDEKNYIALSGPSFANEVARKIPTAIVSASKSITSAKKIQKIFMTPALRVYVNDDITGVELGGALKNVIAIAAGICDGVGFGENTKAALITRSVVEITRLGTKMGAKIETFSGLSGIGDLILTCMGKLSRNRFLGEEIGKGKKLEDVLNSMVMIAEGVKTAKSAYFLAKKFNVETPIMEKVYKVLFEGENPEKAVNDLMTRQPKAEIQNL
ncbi:glycerol-3-phosphate dehydrogenase [candidate division KSB1 bacterium]|nr:MAG: glycerol-3-phosphate dehydrogenase [candidate division KSB1 bacterium]